MESTECVEMQQEATPRMRPCGLSAAACGGRAGVKSGSHHPGLRESCSGLVPEQWGIEPDNLPLEEAV